MPTGADLMGLGMAPTLADLLGNTPNLLTCAGSTSQTGAAAVKSTLTELSAAGGANSALLSAQAPIGSPYYFFTSSATTAIVYVPVGDYLNNSQNAGLSIAQNKGAIMWQYKTVGTTGYWASVLTA